MNDVNDTSFNKFYTSFSIQIVAREQSNVTFTYFITLPSANITYNGNTNIAYLPHYLALYSAPYTGSTQVPADNLWTLLDIKRTTSRNQNIIFTQETTVDRFYQVFLFPCADLNGNFQPVNPTAFSNLEAYEFSSSNDGATLLATLFSVIAN